MVETTISNLSFKGIIGITDVKIIFIVKYSLIKLN